MTKPSVEDIQKIVSLIAKKPVEQIRPESELRAHLGMDSLAALDMLVTIEEKYGIVIAQEKAASFVTLGDVLKHLETL